MEPVERESWPVDWEGASRQSGLLARARTPDEVLQAASTAILETLAPAALAVWQYAGGHLSLSLEHGLPSGRADRPRWTDLFKLPLTSGGLLLGVLEVYSLTPDGFNAAQRAVLHLLGGTLAVALHRARLDDQLAAARRGGVEQARLLELELLDQLTRATSHSVGYAQFFESLTAALAQAWPYRVAALLAARGPRPEVWLAVGPAGSPGQVDDAVRCTLAAWRGFGGEPLQPAQVQLHARGDQPPQPPASAEGGLALPLTEGDELAGVLYLLGANPAGEPQVRALHAFAERASAALTKVRELLSEEIERLSTIIASLPQGIVLLDAAGQVLLANRPGGQQLALLGADTTPVAQLGELSLNELILEAVATGHDLTRREIALRADDRSWHLRVTVVAVRDGSEVIGTVLSIEDITEVRQTEQRLFHDARLASIGEFASGLAHELNNPMMILLGLAEVLAEDPSIPAERRPLLQDIQAAALRAAGIVQQMMLFADTQGSEGVDHLQLHEVLEQAIALIASRLEWDGAAVELDWAADLPPVRGHAGKLQQLTLNLVRNAAEAIRQSGVGGRIVVRTRAVVDEVWLEVEDDGPGVPAELRERVFDVFFTTKRDYQGKGLGLAEAHRIAQEHRGRLELLAGESGGALLRLRLPREPA
ncbi:MAG: PAS domain-containing protein [Fimbriimonadaceae bacterium]|nr:PAS domain-containing protein [Fimbriimonadaceae bacterium]